LMATVSLFGKNASKSHSVPTRLGIGLTVTLSRDSAMLGNTRAPRQTRLAAATSIHHSLLGVCDRFDPGKCKARATSPPAKEGGIGCDRRMHSVGSSPLYPNEPQDL